MSEDTKSPYAERNAAIVYYHDLGATFHDLAKRLGISRARVAQIYEQERRKRTFGQGKPNNHIAHLGLNGRTYNALWRAGIETVEDLIDFLTIGTAPDGKNYIRNFGELARQECTRALSAHGVVKPDEVEDFFPTYAFLPEGEWNKCMAYWGYKCVCCGRPYTAERPLVQDHWLPKSSVVFGGSEPDNIIPLCAVCNTSKSGEDPLTWFVKKLGHRKGLKRVAEILVYFDLYWKAKDKGEA